MKLMGSFVEPLSNDDVARRDWRVYVDGVEAPDVRSIELMSRFGVLRYGRLPPGYDGWSFREAHGGVVIAPFVREAGALRIGLVREPRFNMGGEVWNVPRGFIDEGEEPIEAARRELKEETGLSAAALIQLGGPVNCNSAFFETALAGSGAWFFAAELNGDLLSQADAAGAALAFVSLEEALRSADMFTLAAVGRLMGAAHAHA